MAEEQQQSSEEKLEHLERQLAELQQQQKKGSKRSVYILGAAMIITGLLIAGSVVLGGSSGNAVLSFLNPSPSPISELTPCPSTSTPTLSSTTPDITKVDTAGEPYIGDANAPVTMAYWFDFQCPFCKRFETQTMPTLMTQYVNTGKVKIVLKDFQFLGPDSQDAGLVANAVWSLYPDQYLKWHQAMFAAQDGENTGFGDLNSLIQLIRTQFPKMDANKILQTVKANQCKYQQELDTDKAEAASFGIKGTPGFIIGNQLISGAVPTSTFTKALDAQLNQAKTQ